MWTGQVFLCRRCTERRDVKVKNGQVDAQVDTTGGRCTERRDVETKGRQAGQRHTGRHTRDFSCVN